MTSGRSVHGSTWLCSELTLPNAARILPTLHQELARQLGQRQEPFLELDAFLAERDEEVGARIRIDDRLERRFRFVHLERRARIDRVSSRGAKEVADHRHVRVEHLDVGERCSLPDFGRAQAALRPARPGGAAAVSSPAPLNCRQLRFERAQTIVEFLSELIDLLLNLLRLVGGLRRRVARRRDESRP